MRSAADRRRVTIAVLSVAALLGVAAGCSGDDGEAVGDAGGTTAAPVVPQIPEGAVDHQGEAEVVVSATDNRFADQHIVVTTGTAVTWINDGRNDHNVTPDVDGAFAGIPTDTLTPGGTGTVVFDEPGSYAYHCTLHGAPGRAQFGTVVVV